MEGARNPCKKGGLALHPLKGWIKTKWPLSTPPLTLPKPLPPSLLHQDGRVPPQSTTNGTGTWPGQPIERRQRHRDGSAPKGPQAAGHSGGGTLRCFCCPPSSAELSRLPPAAAEPSRTQPSPAELLDAPAAAARVPPSERASELAALAAEEAPPQGEEVPSLRRPPAAEAGPVAPRRERPAEAARPRGRAPGVDVAPARLPPPPARRLSSLSRR